MDADYLKSTLGDLLSEGLSATVLTNPRDKIGYLGEWLLQHVEEKRLAKERTEAKARELRKDEEEQTKLIEEDEKQRAADLSEQETAAEREKQFIAVIEKGESMETLLPTFLSLLRDATGATSAYFGEVETNKETEESSLKYLAATAENEWLLEKRLESKRGKNTFSLFAPEEEEPEEEDEDGNPIPRPPKQLRSVFVPNVLLGPKSQHMFFFKKPQLGSYTAVRLQFPQSVSDEVLDEAAEREEEIMTMKKEQDEAREQAEREAREEAAREAGEELNEDDEDEDDEDEDEDEDDEDRSARRRKKKSASDDENIDETDEEREARLKREDDARQVEEEEFLLSQLQRQPIQYALCLDTLGQNRRFSDEQLATITRFATLLQTKLQSLDRAGFTVARRQRAALLEFNREVAELNDQGTLKTDDEKAEELERASDELEALGKPMTEEDVVYKYRTDLILGSLKAQIADWAQCEVFRGSLAVLQGVLFLLGYPQSSVVNSIGQPEWRRIRKVLLNSEEFFTRFKDYDPRATHFEQVKANAPEKLYTESVSVGKVVEPIEYDEVKVRNYALSELLLWVREALAVKRRAKLERAKDARRKQRAAEAAAEAARLEAEAAAEAAERAANGEEDEGEDGEEEEEDE